MWFPLIFTHFQVRGYPGVNTDLGSTCWELSPGGEPGLSPQLGTTAGRGPGQLLTALSNGAVFQSLGEMFERMSSCCVPELKLFPMSPLEVKMTSQDAGADSFEDKINALKQ